MSLTTAQQLFKRGWSAKDIVHKAKFHRDLLGTYKRDKHLIAYRFKDSSELITDGIEVWVNNNEE